MQPRFSSVDAEKKAKKGKMYANFKGKQKIEKKKLKVMRHHHPMNKNFAFAVHFIQATKFARSLMQFSLKEFPCKCDTMHVN